VFPNEELQEARVSVRTTLAQPLTHFTCFTSAKVKKNKSPGRGRGSPPEKQARLFIIILSVRFLRVQKHNIYLLFWYKSTKADWAEGAGRAGSAEAVKAKAGGAPRGARSLEGGAPRYVFCLRYFLYWYYFTSLLAEDGGRRASAQSNASKILSLLVLLYQFTRGGWRSSERRAACRRLRLC